MEVTDEDSTDDLGTQLDGKTRGPLKTFVVDPGASGAVVTLSMQVVDGSDEYAAQLKRLETGGQVNDQANLLSWSEANDGGNTWTRHENNDPGPYFTKDNGSNGGINWGGSPITYSFDLFVDPATPADFYDLEFALGGKEGGRWYQDEHFYLQVIAGGGLACDFNSSSTCDDADIDLLAAAVRDGTSNSLFNVDGQGDPNIPDDADFDFYITDNSMIGTGFGDYDLNFLVNFNDFVRLANNFNLTGTGWGQGNGNTDDITNFKDFVRLSNNFGMSFVSGVSVPEPSAAAMFFLAVAAGGFAAHRRRV